MGELFNILKDGFDVPETIVHSNGALEFAAVIGEYIQTCLLKDYCWMLKKQPERDILFRYRRLFSLSGFLQPLTWLLSTLEFLPGHRLARKKSAPPLASAPPAQTH